MACIRKGEVYYASPLYKMEHGNKIQFRNALGMLVYFITEIVTSALHDGADPFRDLDDDLELEDLINKVHGGT